MTWVRPPIDSRTAWGALPPKSNPGPFVALAATVCHYTAAPRGYVVPQVDSHERCRSQVRSIQRQHQAIPNQSDIEYTALACNHGVLMEGRVPGYKTGANGTLESNRTMPSVCTLLGIGDVPSQEMLNAVGWFHWQVEMQAGMPLLMKKHKEITSTSCPGDWMSHWVDLGAYRQSWPEAPDEEDDMRTLTRFRGYNNVFLRGGGGAEQVTPEEASYWLNQSVVSIVADPHPQALRSCLHQTGLTAVDLVPNGEVPPWYTG